MECQLSAGYTSQWTTNCNKSLGILDFYLRAIFGNFSPGLYWHEPTCQYYDLKAWLYPCDLWPWPMWPLTLTHMTFDLDQYLQDGQTRPEFFSSEFFLVTFFPSNLPGQTQGDAWAQVGTKMDTPYRTLKNKTGATFTIWDLLPLR